jgi:hypothetical protein
LFDAGSAFDLDKPNRLTRDSFAIDVKHAVNNLDAITWQAHQTLDKITIRFRDRAKDN